MAEPLRVVRIITRLNIGGPAIHATLLSSRLDPARFSTCLVVGEPDAHEGDLSDLVDGQPVQVVRIRTLRRPIHVVADVRAFVRLLRVISRQRPQVIHTHMAKAGALGRLAGLVYNAVGPGRRSGARAVLIHTFHGHVLEGYFSAWLTWFFVTIERVLARRTDGLIAVSPAIQRDLLRRGIGRLAQWRVIPLGVDLSGLARVPMSNGSEPFVCGMVGRLVPIKNPGLFLRALAKVHHGATTPVRGRLIGDGPLRGVLEEESKQLGLETVVSFTGWQRDLPAVYGGLAVVCLTSWNEGTPVSVIEAMAAGRAVVATDVGGVRDLLEEAGGVAPAPIPPGGFRIAARGLLVRPDDPEGLAAALKTLAGDAALRRRLGEAGRSYAVQTFGAQRLVHDIERLYTQMITEAAGCMP